MQPAQVDHFRAHGYVRLAGIQAFVLIDDVVPQGGATLILAGSQHVGALPDQHAQTLRDTLKTSTDLPADLRALGIEIVACLRPVDRIDTRGDVG